MDWTQELSVIDSTLYAGDRWLGEFSSHAAAMGAIRVMRKRNGMRLLSDIGHEDLCDLVVMTDEDADLIEAIDADEV